MLFRSLLTDRASVSIEKQLGEMLAASLSGSRYATNGLGTTSFERNRYNTLSARLSWRLAERWTLDGSYSHERREVEGQPQTAQSDYFYLTITYSPGKLSVSR